MYPIELLEEANNDPVFSQFPTKFNMMHWHNDMPGLPDKSVLLASSKGCPRQAIRYGDRVYGLQFHMEMTAELLSGMVAHCAHDLKPSLYVQDKEKLLTANLTAMNKKLYNILDYLVAFK